MARGTKSAPGALSKEIAATLRAQLARKQFSQADLAEAVQISQTQLSGILNAKKHVDIEQLDEICFALGLTFRQVIADADKATAHRFSTKSGWTTGTLSD